MSDWPLPRGFRFAGVISKLRSEPDRRDLAVIVSDAPAAAAGVFTQNRVCAAPVLVSQRRVPSATVRAVVVCSGNANACTGEQGLRDAERMAELVANELGCSPEQVLVASTGVIGRPLPMPVLEAGIPQAVHAASATREGLLDAAHAILTTDTRIKVAVHDLGGCTVAGFAKGAAMIGPNMATMLGFLVTDAAVSPDDLHRILKRAADHSFNCISVEGHTSTNDTVFALAGGDGPKLAGNELDAFAGAVDAVCGELARKIAADAEGAEHLITIDVEGCRSDAEARTVAKAVAESALVKAAVYGADPNWGRVVSAAGYCGVPFDPAELSLWMGDLLLFRDGGPVPFDPATASAYLKANREVHFRLAFKAGPGRCRFYTSDLTPEYVKLNADYTTRPTKHFMPDLLRLESLSRTFGRRPALDAVTLRLPPGRVGLLGPNGAGKSTLLKLLMGLLPPTGGRGWVLDHPLGGDANWRLRRLIGFMPEADALVPGLTGVEYVALAGELYGMSRKQALRRGHEVLTYLELEEARYRKVEEYSAGMKQRAKLAQALVHDPPVLLLDEPTSGLDPSGRDAMLRLIVELSREHGKSVLLSTHLLADVRAVCERVVILNGGRVVGVGTVDELCARRDDRFRVRVSGDVPAYRTALQERGVEVCGEENDLRVTVPAGWQSREFFALAERSNATVRSLTRDDESLEELFVKAIDSDSPLPRRERGEG